MTSSYSGHTLIIGSEGSMGRRYQAVLRYLKAPFLCYDNSYIHNGLTSEIKISLEEFVDCHRGAINRVIIATPTDTHWNIYRRLGLLLPLLPKSYILCEKPLSKNLEQVAEMVGAGVDMMFQYTMLKMNSFAPKPFYSLYDYFRAGKDEVGWDCMQIIALHNGGIEDLNIKTVSPVWKCRINNAHVSIAGMDEAYVKYVSSWLKQTKGRPSAQKIIDAHIKVLEWQEYGPF